MILHGLAPGSIHASTLWTGPTISYNQPSPDPTQEANQDRLTDNVWLTRGSTEGLFNYVTEASYDKPIDLSPHDTEWAYGDLSNYASLNYTAWAAMSGNHPPTMVGQPVVLHLITDDIYLSLTFTFWGGPGGGFAYTRSTPAVSAPPPTVSITTPTNGLTFAAPANVKIIADASVSSGNVTNVNFFRADTLIGSAQSAPFSVTNSNLAAGGYSFTAVASAAGVSSTSAPVNITVVTPIVVTSSTPKITNGQFSFNYTANPGLNYVVQQSSNLSTWLPVSTNTASANSVHFTDIFHSNATRFYRVGRLPNP